MCCELQQSTLLGHEWLVKIRLDWHNLEVTTLHSNQPPLKVVVDKCADVFTNELGTLRDLRLNFLSSVDPTICTERCS